MEQNSDFLFFKRGIEPLWEHPANQDGGKWVLTVKNDSESLAKSWLEVVSLNVKEGLGRHSYTYANGLIFNLFSVAAAVDWWLCGEVWSDQWGGCLPQEER